MSCNSLCSGNVFVVIRKPKSREKLSKILDRFDLGYKDFSGAINSTFMIEGAYSLSEIHDYLVVPLVEFLDPEKRSSIFFRSPEGRISTFMVQDGLVKTA